MTATPANSPESGTGAGAPRGLTSTGSGAVSAGTRSRLAEARSLLAAAAEDLDGWLARRAAPGRTYVQDGHDAIGRLDAATHLLYQVRAMLVSQLRADEDERAVRVDRLIAELREERAARSADQPELGAPGRDRSEG